MISNSLRTPKNQGFSIIFRHSFLNSTLVANLGAGRSTSKITMEIGWLWISRRLKREMNFRSISRWRAFPASWQIGGFGGAWGRLRDWWIMRGRYPINVAFPWCFWMFFSAILNDIHTDSYMVIKKLQVAWRCCCNFQAHRAKPKSSMSRARM